MLELYGTKSCPYTQEMREWLEWKGTEFVEYDVEADVAARERMRSLANGQRTVPMLVDGGKVVQIGWQGRGCVVGVEESGMASACSIKVRGVVQGVGFRPFVFRLARANTLAGWVLNGEQGVEIFLEGADQGLKSFVHTLRNEPPPAAQITDIEVRASNPVGCNEFTIRESRR